MTAASVSLPRDLWLDSSDRPSDRSSARLPERVPQAAAFRHSEALPGGDSPCFAGVVLSAIGGRRYA